MAASEDSILSEIDSTADEIVDFLSDSVRVGGVTGQEGPATDFYERRLAGFGWSVKRQPLAGSPLADAEPTVVDRANLVVDIAGAGRDLLVVNGHVDVVPPGDRANWTDEPFSGRVVDGRLYGRGAVDTRSGIASAVFALRALERTGVTIPYDVRLELVIGEERTGVGTRLSLASDPRRPAAAIVLEPTDGHVVPISTGLLFFTVTVDGLAAHTSAPWRGVDAFAKLLTVRDLLLDLAARRSASYTHPLFDGLPTAIPFAVGMVRAGDYPASVPASASMSGRIGLMPGEEPAEVAALVEDEIRRLGEHDDWLAAHPVRVTWQHEGLPGWETAPGHPLVVAFARAQETVYGAGRMAGFTAGSDAAYYGGHGVPTLVFGPGEVALAHAPDESVPVSAVVAAAKVLALAVAGHG